MMMRMRKKKMMMSTTLRRIQRTNYTPETHNSRCAVFHATVRCFVAKAASDALSDRLMRLSITGEYPVLNAFSRALSTSNNRDPLFVYRALSLFLAHRWCLYTAVVQWTQPLWVSWVSGHPKNSSWGCPTPKKVEGEYQTY